MAIGWEMIEPIATIVATIGTAVAAVAAFKTANLAKKQIDEGTKPVLTLSGVESRPGLQYEDYPVNLFLKNSGKGTANILVLDIDADIKAYISTPINIGSDSESNIKILLPTKDEEHSIRLGIYFWDIQDYCYRTEIQVHITYATLASGGSIANWRVDRDRTVVIGKRVRPDTPQHWDKDIRTKFYEIPWWKDDQRISKLRKFMLGLGPYTRKKHLNHFTGRR